MIFKQDGTRLPDYVAETRRRVRRERETHGGGGTGLHEARDEARRRGVGPETPPMAMPERITPPPCRPRKPPGRAP